ncbi:hypothetical protein BDV96DRAFT_606521 [Lophiotrema nucula]|uniref:Uncharacterized protein n=1 Tax=Lophiotrema nucula TaxID=690887 RepID=A0A6A5YKE2_9PLEO|nr:hypothetical protein BDV96DRAFT_606521 [Lophiotrema nucula]
MPRIVATQREKSPSQPTKMSEAKSSTPFSSVENKINIQTNKTPSSPTSTSTSKSTATTPVLKGLEKPTPIYSSRKEETLAKMTEKYGAPGSKDEYRDTEPLSEIRPPTVPTKDKSKKANNDYLTQVRGDKELRQKIKAFVNEHWWIDVCKSANTPEFHDKLFEPYMFDKDGVLDRKNPAFGKVVEQLAVAWMHIRKKYSEQDPREWSISFHDHKKMGPYIVANNKTQDNNFGLTPPKNGWFDHSAELDQLRADRNAGKSFEIPEEKKGYDGLPIGGKKPTMAINIPNKLSLAAQGIKDIEDECLKRLTTPASKSPSVLGGFFGGSSPATSETESVLAKRKALEEYEAKSTEDWDDYDIIEETETELFENNTDDVLDFEEAKEKEKLPEDREDYVYSKKDAKSGRKGWFW